MEHRRNRPYPTAQQKARLISLLKKDPELMRGKFTDTFTKQDSITRWNTVSIELNSLLGAKKTAAEWRKTWQDMKSKFKKKQSLRKTPSQSEDSPSLSQITDSQMLYTLKESAFADVDCEESNAYVLDDPSTSTETASANLKLGISEDSGSGSNPVDNDHDVDVDTKPAPRITNPHQLRIRGLHGKKKIMTQKKMRRSSETMAILERSLREKNELKRQFYKDFLKEMRRQTDAFLGIASACSLIASNSVAVANNEYSSE